MEQKILVVDDDEGVLSALNMLLKSEGFSPCLVWAPRAALRAVRQQDFCLVLMDLNYSMDTTSGDEGLELIEAIRRLDEFVPIVVMTGWGTIEVAVNAMKIGASDFVQKPWENDRLLTVIQTQTKLARVQKQSQKLSVHNKLLSKEVGPSGDIVAESPVIKGILQTLQQVADTNVSVLFTGENGTGKSMFARYLHGLSTRGNTALVTVNMGAVTESLFESEMFGHVKGAFTDAKDTRIGRFELADGGTLFLDEIANTPYSQQGKLLRVLEEYQFEKVGSRKTQKVDFRLLAATNADLKQAVGEGEFREDLLYRINTLEIEIPALRERVEDIIPLAEAFLKKAAEKYSKPVLLIDSAAESILKSYPWPGNVRELGHMMERLQILCNKPAIEVQDLDGGIASKVDQPVAAESDDLRSLADIEADVITRRLAYFADDAVKAAESLGLSRSAFYRRLSKLKE